MKNSFKACLLFAGIYLTACSLYAQSHEHKTLIVFFDGLRPDYITPEGMPNLYAFKQQGAYGNQHHSIFPTVTRVNSSGYSSGSYPAKTGLMGNTVYFPQVDSTKGMDTGDARQLKRIEAATGGHLLTSITLGEVLQAAGKKMIVFSSGSTGQALLQNHTLSGGAIINTDMILPDSISSRIISEVGPIPARDGRHQWITDALIRYGLTADGPAVSAIWFSDPDGTAHAKGIGSPEAVASIKVVDEQFGRIISYLKSSGLIDSYNVLISTDHGFVTHIGKAGVTDLLMSRGMKASKTSTDVVVSDGAIYVKNHDLKKIQDIVSLLQSEDMAGAVFTKAAHPGDLTGSVKGTLSFESIHWNHPTRAADILVAPNWNDAKNDKGYAGTDMSGGVAGHGGSSPYEIHIPFIVSGPDFKSGYTSDIPTSNVDITPTVLALQHLQIPAQMDGRVVSELLKTTTNPLPAVKVQKTETSVKTATGTYQLMIQRSVMGNYQYVDFTRVTRK